ncbi:amidohydrolase [Humibacter sp. RRB41]|uniref:amidohydrolase n=1 Tax=Humibacter sp. RRB41 TaxID=2919946 RepID=UPI0027E3822D|nr:amidohydrolase [Humibacter sp. RRB41]
MTRAADTVFTGGSIFSEGMTVSRPGGVAVTNGLIVAAGDDDELRGLVAPRTRVVDLHGGLLLPGFQDAHAHPVQGGVELLQCNLVGAADAAECVARVAAYRREHPDEEWITGGGWSMEFFTGGTPTAAALDAVITDRPVMLHNRDHHGVWVNSRALQLAGIDASTRDPADGRIERDADGSPTGTLHEGAAALVERLIPPIDADFAYSGLLRAQRELLALGITGWQDAMVGAVFGLPDIADTYHRAVEEGALVARVVGAQWWERDRGVEQLEEMLTRRDAAGALGHPERFRLDSVKIMLDGVAENFTAAMTKPYFDGHGHATENSGHSFLDPEALADAVVAIDAAGLQVHLHALGDRAVREGLDALERARGANGVTDGRHHLAHLQVVDSVDVPRFAALGAAANIQAFWASHEPQMDELTIPFLDPSLVDRQYVFAELRDAGARLAGGSDWPVSTADPLEAAHAAVNRVDSGEDVPPLGPEQALDLGTFLAAYTAGSAWVNHRDATTGHLAVGYAADLAVLDRDPFRRPADEIADAVVVGTWVDGQRAYGA